MNPDIESTLLLVLFFFPLVIIPISAAKGWPKGWRSATYLIVFAVTLFVDAPLLLVLYITPKASPAFGLVDLLSDVAVVLLGVSWGCFIGFFVLGKLDHGRESGTQTPSL